MEEAIQSDNSDELSIRKFYMRCKDPSVIDEYEKFIYISEDNNRSDIEQQRAKTSAQKIIQRFTAPKL